MGCNCKKAKKVYDALTPNEEENEGLISKYTKGIIGRIIQAIVMFSVILIAFPFAYIYLFFAFILFGDFTLKLPKFLTSKF